MVHSNAGCLIDAARIWLCLRPTVMCTHESLWTASLWLSRRVAPFANRRLSRRRLQTVKNTRVVPVPFGTLWTLRLLLPPQSWVCCGVCWLCVCRCAGWCFAGDGGSHFGVVTAPPRSSAALLLPANSYSYCPSKTF